MLRDLRHTPELRYTQLRIPTELESDIFKFHLRKLVHLGYVQHTPSGVYSLTIAGKEFANNIDAAARSVQKQPKLSMAIVISRDHDGQREYLFQKRLRQPFYGYWGCLSGPVRWGQMIEAAAMQEIKKQTGLTLTCEVRGFCKQSDYDQQSGDLLEDKLFAVVLAPYTDGEVNHTWSKGEHVWMTAEELCRQEYFFLSSKALITIAEQSIPYTTLETDYQASEY